MSWICKECGYREIFRIAYVKGTVQQESFDKNGIACFEEPLDLDVISYENYECAQCGSNARNIKDIAIYEEE